MANEIQIPNMYHLTFDIYSLLVQYPAACRASSHSGESRNLEKNKLDAGSSPA
jgi:hypothetical protein